MHWSLSQSLILKPFLERFISISASVSALSRQSFPIPNCIDSYAKDVLLFESGNMNRLSLDEIDDALTHMPISGNKKIAPDEYDVKLNEYHCLLCQQTIWDDLFTALYDVRFAAPLVAFFAVLLAYHITIAPYRVHIERGLAHAPTPLDLNLNTVRPVISPEKQHHMQKLLLHAETHLELPTFENIKFKFFSFVPEHGNFRMPQMFYHGVTFGITAENSHNIEHTSYSTLTMQDLEAELRHPSFKPNPTFLMRRSVISNDSLWEENGFAVYYSYEDLRDKSGKLSSDVERPWKRILEPILDVARKYKQAYITVWYPRAFGAAPAEAQLQAERIRRRLEDSSLSPVDRIPAVQQAKLVQELQLLPNRQTTKPPKRVFTQQSKVDISNRNKKKDSSPAQATVVADPMIVSSVHRPHSLQHTVLLQEIIPTRTGLDELKSSSVVWLSSVDDIPPHLIDFVRLDEW